MKLIFDMNLVCWTCGVCKSKTKRCSKFDLTHSINRFTFAFDHSHKTPCGVRLILFLDISRKRATLSEWVWEKDSQFTGPESNKCKFRSLFSPLTLSYLLLLLISDGIYENNNFHDIDLAGLESLLFSSYAHWTLVRRIQRQLIWTLNSIGYFPHVFLRIGYWIFDIGVLPFSFLPCHTDFDFNLV